MRKAVGAILVLATLVIAIGCASDIVLEEPPPLNGTYDGFYVVQTPTRRDSQPVIFTFGDENYLMKLDTASQYFGKHSFCNVSGQYTLTEGVRLLERTSVPLGGVIDSSSFDACTADENPDGTFTLIRKNSGQSLQLRQQTNDTLSKELYMVRTIDTTSTL